MARVIPRRIRRTSLTLFIAIVVAAALPALAQEAAEPIEIDGAPCYEPGFLHCPDEGCEAATVTHPGAVVEMQSRRTYFLDYPCDLDTGEEVTFVLSLHGGGSYANWQRHYFPLLDYKQSHRLVIATPSSPIRVWTEADDAYLEGIVTSVVEKIGEENIRAFWLAGHSQGGMTSNRLLRSDFFAQRVDGWLSLSGGRLGGHPERPERSGPPPSSADRGRPAISPEMREALMRSRSLLAELPETEFSFIFTTGEREMAGSGLPAQSEWAAKLGCGEQKRVGEVVDERGGYVYDTTRQDPPSPSWGLLPGPGKAAVYRYEGCRPGRVVADVVRLEKGHTEGLEPEVTKTLVELMLEAKGGRIRGR
ncbi:MAG: alpha/beta hydrolase [Acidobacteria bacterium]|nr:MAG: alpha/beta hydrolase [Acidobacteriota bacterium]REK03723.1 MAG: alpha/beta hydrolase [Acidobacteriota bacterium]